MSRNGEGVRRAEDSYLEGILSKGEISVLQCRGAIREREVLSSSEISSIASEK